MDAVSTAWSVFTTCYSVYTVVSEVIELNSDSKLWNVQMRVERVRFEVWGRTLGFLDEKTGSLKSLDSEDVAMNSGGLSEIVQVEMANKLICDLLEAIALALKEFQETAEKYSLEKKSPGAAAVSNSRREKAAAGLSKAWSSTKVFTKHVVYVLADKGLVEQLVQKLSGLNDSLEKVLTLHQKVQYAKAVSSGVLVKYRQPKEIDSLLEALEDGERATTQPGILVASARVKQLCVRMDSPDGAGSDAGEVKAAEPGSFKLAPNIVRGYRVPVKAKEDLHWPVGIATYTTGAEPARRVMVEWRSAHPSTPRFLIEQSELVRRRDAIAQLLHKTSTMADAGDYRLLDCLGYVETTGGSDGQDTNVVGFVSLFPDWADEEGEPVTLHSLLQSSFDSDKTGTIPSLRTRFSLARDVANALYQLQCSNWVHRNLSSHQVVFFRDKNSGALRLERPYLIGFQYSRPDDNTRGQALNVFSEGFSHNGDFPELYLPAEFSGAGLRRYKRSDDVYSMGVMLFEIAFWEPVGVFHEKGQSVWDTARKVLDTAATELPSEVGELYADAVLRCLRGLRQGEVAMVTAAEPEGGKEAYDGAYHGEDPEFGLEVDFLWKVLREIEKCRV
ncbi:prion-inhibition and propagation-domain-containing protein [Parachaetomium inaequale]|uniref:Prion-inhibition and propagation-domain-containing protein n=1 Tax=Parachaetomium inaequale TaxID=2588326 RepID=A0AAN6PMY9_9PEZI|nr:prion-inhibition and propagation-domain-containing protein [Parachaetomium inaequale]